MILKRRKDYTGTVRSVRTDDGARLAIIGTVGDLLDEEVFDMCDGRRDLWAVVHMDATADFYTSRDAAIDALRREESRRA